MNLRFLPLTVVLGLTVAPSVLAATRTVGPGKTFAKPCLAFAAAADGDTIEIDAAGSYAGDVCAITKSNLIIKGVGGRAKIDAAGKSSGGKAIWVVQGTNTTIEDVELSGCTVPDNNGAGIRQEGKDLTVRRVYFHDNENGILTGANTESNIVVEDSEFGNNGAGDGQSHNMYIGEIKSFTLRGSYSHHAKVGHLVKSRALENNILYNRLTDETGTASYEIDLPQGGRSYVIGNILQQASGSSNGSFISFARESKRNPDSELFVVNNTFFNSRGAGTFVAVAGNLGTPVVLRNNIFAGPGTVCDQASAIKDSNFVGDPMFVNQATYDFHLKAGSPALEKGVPAGTGSGRSLAPVCQYVHPAMARARTVVGILDQGGFELGGETTMPCGGTVVPGDSGPAPDASPADAGGPPSDAAKSDTSTTGSDATATDTATTTADGSTQNDGALGDETATGGDAATDDSGASLDDAGETADAESTEASGCSCRTSSSREETGGNDGLFAALGLFLAASVVRRRSRDGVTAR